MFTNKELRSAKRAIERSAALVGETSRQFRLELMKAIDASRRSEDPSVMAEWAAFGFAREKPTPEEFVAWCARRVIENNSIE